MTNPEITLIETEGSPEAEFILTNLRAYNVSKVGPSNAHTLVLVSRDEKAEISGGLKAFTSRNWLFIELLWVSEESRLQRLGSSLLNRAEEIARERGCLFAHLDTFSFQALDFYQKHGYEKFGELHEYPPGHSRYYLKKNLTY